MLESRCLAVKSKEKRERPRAAAFVIGAHSARNFLHQGLVGVLDQNSEDDAGARMRARLQTISNSGWGRGIAISLLLRCTCCCELRVLSR